MQPVQHLTDDEFAHQVQRTVRALPDAPLAWQQAAVALWPAPPSALAGTAQALVGLIRAVLSFDSWATPGLAHGMRSTRASTRHLLYSAQGRDIDLRITPALEHFALSGQVLGPDESGRVELMAQGSASGASHASALDAMGEFRLEDVPAGRYVLTLHLGAETIVVQPLEVGEPGA